MKIDASIPPDYRYWPEEEFRNFCDILENHLSNHQMEYKSNQIFNWEEVADELNKRHKGFTFAKGQLRMTGRDPLKVLEDDMPAEPRTDRSVQECYERYKKNNPRLSAIADRAEEIRRQQKLFFKLKDHPYANIDMEARRALPQFQFGGKDYYLTTKKHEEAYISSYEDKERLSIIYSTLFPSPKNIEVKYELEVNWTSLHCIKKLNTWRHRVLGRHLRPGVHVQKFIEAEEAECSLQTSEKARLRKILSSQLTGIKIQPRFENIDWQRIADSFNDLPYGVLRNKKEIEGFCRQYDNEMVSFTSKLQKKSQIQPKDKDNTKEDTTGSKRKREMQKEDQLQDLSSKRRKNSGFQSDDDNNL